MKNIRNSKFKVVLGTTALLSSVLLMQHISADQIIDKGVELTVVTSPLTISESAPGISSSPSHISSSTSEIHTGISDINSTESSESTSASKPTGSSNVSKPSESTSASKPTGSSNVSKPSESTSASKPTGNGNVSKPSESTSASKPTGSSNVSKPSESMSASKLTVNASTQSVGQGDLIDSNRLYIVETTNISVAPVSLSSTDAVSPIKTINTSSTSDFIKSIAPRIRILAGKNNLFASVIIAQAILESNYGKSYLAQNAFSLFNLTGEYKGKSYNMDTIEYNGKIPYNIHQSFRIYPNFDDSLLDYLNLMLHGTTWNSNIYSKSWKSEAKNYQAAAQGLQGVYATDPNYSQLLIELIQEYHLDQYDDVSEHTQLVPEIASSDSLNVKGDFPEYNGVEYPGSDSYAFGNCTQYVYNRIFQLGGKIGQFMGNGGEWGQSAKLQGYVTTKLPSKGFAVSFPPGVAGSSSVYGHVAFVEKVYSDGSILVSEMNVIGNNQVSTRHISNEITKIATFIQPK